MLKATKEKQQIIYKGTPTMLPADFSTETHKSEGNGMINFK